MASNYPGSLDSFDTIASDKKTSDAVGGRTHRQMHNDLGDAIEAVQGELGTNPSGSDATVAARLSAIEAGTNLATGAVTSAKIADDTITAAQIAANAVGASELADNAVDTNAIANDAVTAAKIAADAVGTSEIAAGAVGTAEIADAAVTSAKLGSDVRIGNLLTTAQAGVSTTGLFTLTGCTEGAAGVFTANTTGVFGARYNVTTDVIPGQTYTFTATIAPTGRAMHIYVQWYDAGIVTLLGSFSGNTIAAGSSGVSTFTGVAPANAGYVRFYAAYGASGNNGDTVTVTKVGWWKGTGGTWSLPGQPILGLTDAPIGNLLTLNQASGYADATIASRCTRTNNTFTASATTSSMSAGYRVNGITAGAIYSMEVNATTSGINSIAGISWRNASDSQITYSLAPGTVTAGTTGTLRQTVTAPAGAVSCIVYMVDGGPVTAGVTAVTLNRVGLWLGAAGQWALPGTVIPGTSHIATNGAVHLSGTGSPEGVVTAAPGSTWLQTDATTDVKGWIRWVKATGTGNTGWVAGPEADTGWRNIAALLINSWTANMIQMRRVGSRVEVKSGLLKGGATISTQMLVIPTGFDFSSGAVNGTVFREDGVSGTPGWLLAAHGTLNAYGGMLDGSSWTVNHGVSMETSWLTDEGWPSSLPGSAV